jgi:uncharacterized membrane protein YphA (DoxX/SURF4 family)
MTQPALGSSNPALLWVVVAFGALGALCLLVGVAIRPSSFAYLVLLVPALVMVVGGIVLLRRGRRR